jgi:nucleoside-diphosphate-sugar epimerase
MKVLLTGANGFLGTSIGDIREYGFIPIVRKINKYSPKNARAVGNIDSNTDFSKVLPGLEVVIHAAARAHIMVDEVADPLTEYRKVNVVGSENLARQTAEAGAKRFIFISSIGVNGINSSEPFSELSPCHPQVNHTATGIRHTFC